MKTPFFIAIALILMMTTLSSAGTYRTLVPGTSNRSDVKNILGNPVKEIQSGRYYEYSSQGHNLKALLVQYDENGIVRSIQLKFQCAYPVSKVKQWFNLKHPGKSEMDFHGHKNEVYAPKGIILHFDGPGEDIKVAGLSHVPVPTPAVSTKPAIKPLAKSPLKMAKQSYDIARKLSDQKRCAEAIPHFRKALRLDPGKNDHYDDLAFCLLIQGKRKEAFGLFKSSMKLKENYYNTYHYGSMLYSDYREKEAIPYLKRSAQLLKPGSKWHWPYLKMGQAHYILMEDAKAITALKQAEKMKPSNADIIYYLGICYDNIGKKNEAIGYYRQYLAQKTTNKNRNEKIRKNLRVLNQSKNTKKTDKNLVEGLFKVINSVSNDLNEK